MADPDLELITKASELLLQNKVPESFWESISKRCIACCSCNFTCPTCTCFDVWDRKFPDSIERVRTWDSCQLDGFMREASRHNPMGTEESRTRRRIHHKLAADVERWGFKTCFLCGRCDDSCPTGIGIKSVCREMVAACS
jgi:formate hydrogenlyase subunit 6/NADH:ubiquinone oxidoreductase subunit I